MVDLDINPEKRQADFVLPQGCPACGGQIDVRVSASGGAHAYCSSCHWLINPHVDFTGQKLTLGFRAAVA